MIRRARYRWCPAPWPGCSGPGCPSAGPASAGSGVGCNGNDCSVLLSSLITLKGDVGAGAARTFPSMCLSLPRRACGSRWASPDNWQPEPNHQPVPQPRPGPSRTAFTTPCSRPRKSWPALPVARPGPGDMLPVNPAASAAAQQQCLTLPLFFFAVAGSWRCPPCPSPDTTLAAFAYNNMLIPAPESGSTPRTQRGRVTSTWPPRLGGDVGAEPHHRPPGTHIRSPPPWANVTVTVWAQPGRIQRLVRAHRGRPRGRRTRRAAVRPARSSRVGHVPATSGAASPPNCGVLWAPPRPPRRASAPPSPGRSAGETVT